MGQYVPGWTPDPNRNGAPGGVAQEDIVILAAEDQDGLNYLAGKTMGEINRMALLPWLMWQEACLSIAEIV